MKKQKLEHKVLNEFTSKYTATKGNKWDKVKGGLKGSLDTLKDYLTTSQYDIKQYKTKNKIAIKNKVYYQKTMNINKTMNNFKSANISLDKGLEGRLSLDLPYLGKQDFDIILDEDPQDPKKYTFKKVLYAGIFHFSYP